MSIALPSPHQTGKRFLDDSDDLQLQEGDCRVPFSHFNPSKRVRHLKSPGKRCGTGNNPAYTFTSSAVAALRSLFPHMSDKVREMYSIYTMPEVRGSPYLLSCKAAGSQSSPNPSAGNF